jgi:hypothetical protein
MRLRNLILVMMLALSATGVRAQTWTPADDSAARVAEAKHKIPRGILQALASRESGFEHEAFRVEISYTQQGGTYFTLIKTRARAFCRARNWSGKPSVETEITQRGSSWLMYQIIGDNIREVCKIDLPFLTMITRARSHDVAATFFRHYFVEQNCNLHHALVAYNGGPKAVTRGRAWYAKAKHNPWEYADDVLKRQKKYSY